MYWQWADETTTMSLGYQSVLMLHPEATTGYYEFPYWYSRFFKLAVNQANLPVF